MICSSNSPTVAHLLVEEALLFGIHGLDGDRRVLLGFPWSYTHGRTAPVLSEFQIGQIPTNQFNDVSWHLASGLMAEFYGHGIGLVN